MDGSRFDALARTLTTAGSRRRALSGLLLGALGLLTGGSAQDAAAHDLKAKCKKKSGAAKKTCLKKAKKHAATHTSDPPPCTRNCASKQCGPDGCGSVCGACLGQQVCDTAGVCCSPNCFDRLCGPNGCGGTCGTCPLAGQVCDRGRCTCPADALEVCGGACVAPCLPGTVRHPETCRCCIPSGQPSGGSSANCCSGSVSGATCVGFSQSACTFDEQCSSGNCLGGRCEYCPKVEIAFAGLDYCAQPGAFRECAVDFTTTGFYVCLQAVDGNTRCGRRNRNVDCNGCSNDLDCLIDLGQGSGAFCVRDTGPGCDCPDGQTFCAVPRPQS